jgi:hypothetical protein
MPLCVECHRGLHDLSGPFKRWNRAMLQAWQDQQVERLTGDRDTF